MALGGAGQPAQDVQHQVETVQAVEHGHIEGRGDGALFLVSVDMEVLVVGPPVGEAMDQGRIPVEGEDDGPVPGEQGVEGWIAQAMGVHGVGLQLHEVHHVHHPHLHPGYAVAEDGHGRQSLQGRHIPATSEDHVPAPQTVGQHGEKTVGVRREIGPDDGGLLVDHMVEEPGILVGGTVVVLAPDVAGQEVVERRQGAPPRQLGGDFQPLGVLVEHGVHHVDEGLVRIEQR